MKYTHLFFDLDHTLWDFEANSEAVLQRLWEEYKLADRGIHDFSAFATRYRVHNDVLWAKFRTGTIRRDELRWKRHWLALLDFAVADSQLAYEMSGAYLEMLPTQTSLIAGAAELLEHCKERGYALHLITNGFELTQWQKLHSAGIARYFGEMITSERCDAMKPRKEIFEYALRCTSAEAEHSLMIGDALEVDVLGAQAAGMDAVYYNPLRLPHTTRPTYEVSDLSALLEIL